VPRPSRVGTRGLDRLCLATALVFAVLLGCPRRHTLTKPHDLVAVHPQPRVFILRLWEHMSIMRFPSCHYGINIIYDKGVTPVSADRETGEEKLHEVAQIEQPTRNPGAWHWDNEAARHPPGIAG